MYVLSASSVTAVKQELKDRRKSLHLHRYYTKEAFRNEDDYSHWMEKTADELGEMMNKAKIDGIETKLSEPARVLFESLAYLNHHGFYATLLSMVVSAESHIYNRDTTRMHKVIAV